MKIADIDLGERPVVLAPMEDVTDASFRILCREAGAAMVTTEFVPSDGLIRDASKAIAKMRTLEEESPVAIQIYGHIPESMVDAARMADRAAELAGGHGADTIDINWGCPVSKIAGRGAGSGMMREPDKLVAITKAVVEAVKTPVTVKTRLGWDDSSKIIVDLAERLQDVGVQALTIHGRTRCQMYKGEADWTLIGEVKNNPRMHIPIIGNGDINSAQRAKEMFDRYGVDGIMVGRARDPAPAGHRRGDAADERPRPCGARQTAFRPVPGPQGSCHGRVRDAPPPVLLFQGPSGLQGDPHQARHFQGSRRNSPHAGLCRGKMGGRGAGSRIGVRNLTHFSYLCGIVILIPPWKNISRPSASSLPGATRPE